MTAAQAPPTRASLGPGSLTWRCFGDARGVLLAQRAGVLQVMHPAIAAALEDHSDVFENPIGRLARSAGPILGVVYDDDPVATGRWVRDQHPPIHGHHPDGRAYHALDPDTYYWAHATFFEAQIAVQDLFGDPLSRRQREQLFEESVTWYGRYGMTMRPVPRDYAAFKRYWQRMFEEVLEPTSLARGAVEGGTHPPPPPSPRIPRPLWNVVGGSAGRAGAWLTRVTLPPEARVVLGVEIDGRDRAGLSAMQAAVRGTWPLVPRRYRMLPRARKAATGRL